MVEICILTCIMKIPIFCKLCVFSPKFTNFKMKMRNKYDFTTVEIPILGKTKCSVIVHVIAKTPNLYLY